MLGPFATASRRIAIHQVSLLSHAACASMSKTTTTTTTTRDRGDRYGPIEWAQLLDASLYRVTTSAAQQIAKFSSSHSVRSVRPLIRRDHWPVGLHGRRQLDNRMHASLLFVGQSNLFRDRHAQVDWWTRKSNHTSVYATCRWRIYELHAWRRWPSTSSWRQQYHSQSPATSAAVCLAISRRRQRMAISARQWPYIVPSVFCRIFPKRIYRTTLISSFFFK